MVDSVTLYSKSSLSRASFLIVINDIKPDFKWHDCSLNLFLTSSWWPKIWIIKVTWFKLLCQSSEKLLPCWPKGDDQTFIQNPHPGATEYKSWWNFCMKQTLKRLGLDYFRHNVLKNLKKSHRKLGDQSEHSYTFWYLASFYLPHYHKPVSNVSRIWPHSNIGRNKN